MDFERFRIPKQPPVNILPADQIVNEDTQLAITGLSVKDFNGNLTRTKLTISSGILNVTLNGATISAGGNNSSTLTLAGSQAQINATLATLRYQGNLNFNGTDNLTIVSTDSTGLTDTDTIRIAVTPVNDSPVGSPTVTLSNTAEDTPIIITAASLLAGFRDVDGDTLFITRIEATNGSLVNNNNGTYIFTPTPNFNGIATLTYWVSDGTTTIDVPSRSFNVTPVNDAPVGSPTAILANTTEDTAINITAASLLTGFSDVDGDALFITRIEATNGSLVNNNNGTYTFTPAPNFNGIATLTYWVSDGTTIVDVPSRSFNVTPVNDAPVGTSTAILANTVEDTAINITAASLLTGFSDVDGNSLSVTNLVATNGNLVNNNNGTYTFNPDANFNGSVTLTYGVTDGTTTLAGQNSKFVVTSVNDAPILQQPIIDQRAGQNQAFTFTIPVNSFIDVDASDALTYSVTQENGSPLPSWLIFNPITRIFAGTPTSANVGILNIKVTATDNAGAKASDVFTLSIGGDIIGTELADSLIGTNGDDNIIGLGGNDTIDGREGNDTIRGGYGNDVLNGGDGDDTFLVSVLYEGNDIYNGGNGKDTIKAQNSNINIELAGDFGVANSIEEITANSNTGINVFGDANNNILDFTNTILTNVVVNGASGNDTITGNSQANTLGGGYGNDVLNGGDGDDTFLVSVLYEGNDIYNGGNGKDTIKAQNSNINIELAGDFGVANSIEEITANGNTGITVFGDGNNNILDFTNTVLTNVVVNGASGNDTITGNSQANTLGGGYGNDVLNGGDGDDTFLVSVLYEGNDIYNGGNGKDTIKAQNSNINIELAGNFGASNSIEEITANGNTGITVFGDGNNNILDFTNTVLTNVVVNGASGNDTITGNSQANTLGGGYGNDVLNGGDGDDTFLVSVLYEGNDIYNGGNGKDTIKAQNSNINIELAGNFDASNSIEEITANGNTGITVFGDANNNILDFTNTILTNVVVNGASGNDTITGNSQANTLGGGYGNDVLNGGDGDDTFLVSVLYEGNDIYNGGNGKDTIKAQNSNINIELAGNFDASNSIEEITANGNTGITVFGDANNNILDFTNTILTNVVVNGASGNDTITGNSQANTLGGGYGNDVLNGGDGDDTFLVSVLYEGNDIYNGGNGKDTIKAQNSNINIELAGNFDASNSIEEITANGNTGITVFGDANNNILDFTNTILTNVVVNGASGNDTITGNSQANTLSGGDGNDSLDGGAENDVLDGGSGNDTLIGGLGNDIYIVDWAGDVVVETSTLTTEIDTVRSAVSYTLGANLENLTLTGSTATTATGNQLNNIITGNSLNNTLTGGAGVDTFVLNKTSADTITDFATDEKLQISASEFGGLTAGSLATTQLLVGAGATAATTAAQRFIFNTTDKSLYFDSDGLNGSAAVKIGVLAGLPTLNSSNFSIVA
jgi:Ca2+-binding RTX toxin-like protein